MTRRRLSQRVLDSWFPTLVRYAGLMLVPYILFVDHLRTAALLPFAGALIFFKNATDAFRDRR